MAQLNFGGVTETVVIRDEFPLEKASRSEEPRLNSSHTLASRMPSSA